MKKKIISIFTIFCLIFPCLFAVACKKKPEAEAQSPYTYSVSLKGAVGKIDESTLPSEYDYQKQQNVSWTKTGNDYSISVTRLNSISSSANFSLLEGFDYSNLGFKVNGIASDFKILSGTNSNCAKDAYLTDRQFQYEYKNMKTDTSLELDFTNCGWSKITLDVSNLRENNIKYYKVEEDFVTLQRANEITLGNFESFNENTLVVDYGTVFAFDCSEQLAIDIANANTLEKLNYSIFGSKYFTSTNRIQYLKASRNGACQIYKVTSDPTKDGTIRVLSYGGVSFATSLENLTERTLATVSMERETYSGTTLSLAVFKSNSAFLELDASAQKFNYYLINSIDGDCLEANRISEKTIEGTNRVYLEIPVANADGTLNQAKYLVRKPKSIVDYFSVCVDDYQGSATFSNADYILLGENNAPSDVGMGSVGNVYYCYENGKQVQIVVSSAYADRTTDYAQTNSEVTIWGQTGASEELPSVSVDPNVTQVINYNCYNTTFSSRVYSLTIMYSSNPFTEATISLNLNDINLYDAEKIYYSTDIYNNESWKELSSDDKISVSSSTGKTVYYYFESNRSDSALQVKSPNGDIISLTGELKDCFGRQKSGTVTINGTTISLSKVYYLEIVPGYYDAFTAQLIREYDKTAHSISMENASELNMMVALGGYSNSSFKELSTLSEFSIKYNGINTTSKIYYYIVSETNKFICLKDNENNVVSTSTLVYNANKVAVKVNGHYVYELNIVPDYYELGEEFTISLEDATYNLKDNSKNLVILYADDLRATRAEGMVVETAYFFVGELNATYKIIDDLGFEVVGSASFTVVKNIENEKSVYCFRFELPEDTDYVPGTTFTLVKIS